MRTRTCPQQAAQYGKPRPAQASRLPINQERTQKYGSRPSVMSKTARARARRRRSSSISSALMISGGAKRRTLPPALPTTKTVFERRANQWRRRFGHDHTQQQTTAAHFVIREQLRQALAQLLAAPGDVG